MHIMAKHPSNNIATTLASLWIVLLFSSLVCCQLDYRYYDSSCPSLSKIVRSGVWSAMQNETRIAASILRLHFHDCFVNGCDASILLDDTSSFTGEKNALPNRNSARGFEVVDRIKEEVERACPSKVSCADILAAAAREAVYMSGGPYWAMPFGRKDGTTANRTAANEQMPSPLDPLQTITDKFSAKGLDTKDVVSLSGAHTIGFAQCFTFKSRLFDFNSSDGADPALDASLLENLQGLCPNDASSDAKLAPLDPVTAAKFDTVYYRNLRNGSGLLQSDHALMGDSTTAAMVDAYGKNPFLFFKDFAASMVKLAGVGVLTGDDGQVRKNCRAVN